MMDLYGTRCIHFYSIWVPIAHAYIHNYYTVYSYCHDVQYRRLYDLYSRPSLVNVFEIQSDITINKPLENKTSIVLRRYAKLYLRDQRKRVRFWHGPQTRQRISSILHTFTRQFRRIHLDCDRGSRTTFRLFILTEKSFSLHCLSPLSSITHNRCGSWEIRQGLRSDCNTIIAISI